MEEHRGDTRRAPSPQLIPSSLRSWTAEDDESDSGDSTEERHQEEYARARAEEMKRHKQGSTMKGKTYLLIGAEARDKLLGDEGLLNLDPSPPDIDIEVRVDGYDLPSCKKGPLRVETSFVWVVGSNGTKTSRRPSNFPRSRAWI